MYEIRDPIYKSIEFNEFEKAIIDHPYFARLRKIAQLGLAQLVYPGATHNRFIHALGVMHVAGRVWRRLRETSGKLLREYFSEVDLNYLGQMVRLAGLLHDVGHGPFSHATEGVMPPLSSLAIPKSWFRQPPVTSRAKHEDYSVLLAFEMAKSGKTPLDKEMAQDIAALINARIRPSRRWEKRFSKIGVHKLLKSIISGELDADRMDYLLRDSHFAGVAYGHFDIDWLINNLTVSAQGRELVLTINDAGVWAFDDYLLARYHMFVQVYMHKTVNCFEHYLEKIFTNGEIDYKIPSSAREYAELNDAGVIETIARAARNPKNYWSHHLANRIPAKRLARFSKNEKIKLAKIEKLLKQVGIRFFVLTSEQSLSTLVSPRGHKKASLLVATKFIGKASLVPMEKYSELIRTHNQKIHFIDLYIYREDWAKAAAIINKL